MHSFYLKEALLHRLKNKMQKLPYTWLLSFNKQFILNHPHSTPRFRRPKLSVDMRKVAQQRAVNNLKQPPIALPPTDPPPQHKQ